MTRLAKCEHGFFHLGSRCGQIGPDLNVIKLDESHGPCNTYTAAKDEAFTCLIKREDDVATKIWKKLGGEPEGETGEVLPNFKNWYKERSFTSLDLSNIDLQELPDSIASIFGELDELDLSGNTNLWRVPLSLRAQHLNLSDTNIWEVPHLKTVKKITTLGTLADIPKWLTGKDHQLQKLVLDSQILVGDPPDVLSRINGEVHIVIGDMQGSAVQSKRQWRAAALERRCPQVKRRKTYEAS